ncbi:undecaprenyl-diphosphatase [Gammaproteobacteria bacterium 45_16_T64]|nr:undecaprenyl-diphosphatase [Gammaproteobacteria bacterium 45_16_T64]
MDWFQAVFLAIVQGLTEFLPVSSSAHLILPSQLFGWPDQGIAFDVAVHLGTLIAVVAYFRRDVISITRGSLSAVVERKTNESALLGLAVVVATVPAVVVGGLFHDFIGEELRTSAVIACTTIIFGVLLWVADAKGSRLLKQHEMTLKFALLIGCAQAVALIPGTSRSGITITAALFIGFDRMSSARFSMLLSIPLILAAGLLETIKLLQVEGAVWWDMILLGTAVSGLSAYLCIHYFLQLLERIGMLPFVIYRLFLGGFLLFFIVLGAGASY